MTAATEARRLPSNPDAERTVLGALMLDAQAVESVGTLRPGDFHDPRHRAIYEAMAALHGAHVAIDPVTVRDELRRRSTLERAGGAGYLTQVMDGVPRVTQLGEWVRLLKRDTALRRLVAFGERLAEKATSGEHEPEELVAEVDAALLKLGAGLSQSAGPRALIEGASAALASIEHRAMHPYGLLGYSTGLWDLDQLLQGIRPGRMGLIGARLGSGKSILGLQVAAAIADQSRDHGAVLISSLEMDLTELAERRLASLAMVDPTRLHRAPDDERADRLGRLAAAFGKLPENVLVIEDAYTVADLRVHARQVQAERGLSAVLVDYVGLMDSTGAERGAREWEKVQALSKALRRLAAELGVPVIVVAQLNREPEGGGKRRPPTMADLAGSDALGRDAHWAVLIDLEPPPLKGQPANSNKGLADLYVRKNRGGRKGVCRVAADLGFALFQRLDREEV